MKRSCDFPVLPMPELRLYHSRKKCERFLKKHGIPFEPNEGADAQTWTFSDGKTYAVVLYDADLMQGYCNDIGMLAHEAMHITFYALDSIGENEPSEEVTCYMEQVIVQWLCEAHFAWKERQFSY